MRHPVLNNYILSIDTCSCVTVRAGDRVTRVSAEQHFPAIASPQADSPNCQYSRCTARRPTILYHLISTLLPHALLSRAARALAHRPPPGFTTLQSWADARCHDARLLAYFSRHLRIMATLTHHLNQVIMPVLGNCNNGWVVCSWLSMTGGCGWWLQ